MRSLARVRTKDMHPRTYTLRRWSAQNPARTKKLAAPLADCNFLAYMPAGRWQTTASHVVHLRCVSNSSFRHSTHIRPPLDARVHTASTVCATLTGRAAAHQERPWPPAMRLPPAGAMPATGVHSRAVFALARNTDVPPLLPRALIPSVAALRTRPHARPHVAHRRATPPQ